VIVYLDASAMVKLYVEEPGSLEVAELVEGASVVGTALITRAEVSAAMARAARRQVITVEEAEAILQGFRRQWEQVHRLQVTENIVERAAGLAWRFGLRGYDAVHLACAVFWREMIEEPVVLATYDRELWEAARQSGMEAWPEVLA
jgi:predicted nucleic acid-binding protein